jgi:hypothetical protein
MQGPVEIPPELDFPPFPDDEPPSDRTYSKREVLATINQTVGFHPTLAEVIRYTWTDGIIKHVGYAKCIRLRTRYQRPDATHFGSQSCGVPEADWKALVDELNKVKI